MDGPLMGEPLMSQAQALCWSGLVRQFEFDSWGMPMGNEKAPVGKGARLEGVGISEASNIDAVVMMVTVGSLYCVSEAKVVVVSVLTHLLYGASYFFS